ncbi:hypothetical protein [Defluviimonas sp. SAOS-178_SWC]|uniref:hypothetical protein n=1 Tax=Defluviimonas sp. SAOS-178_SWC TaxID=3121287 RepID=UPI00322203AA
MGGTIYRDIEIRGQVFPTAAAAAAHFGVVPDTVRLAVRRGTLHRVGTGEIGAEPCPVRIRGVDYRSAREAARAFGVTAAAIHRALAEGRVDRIGLAQRRGRAHRSREIIIGGVCYPSMRAADGALGFKPGYIARSMKNGRKCAWERILGAAMRLHASKVAA